MDEHVLLEVGLLGELLQALWTSMFLPPVVHFLDMAAQCVFGAKDELAVHAVQLLRLFMHLQKSFVMILL